MQKTSPLRWTSSGHGCPSCWQQEQAGTIRRSEPSQRRRAESVSITEKGLTAYGKWRELCLEVETVSLQGFTGEERARFLDYLARMYENLTGRVME